MTGKVDNTALLVRRALAHEAARVREIVRAAYSKWIPVIGREPTPMTADFNQAIREHDVDLAIIGENIVGLIETWQRADHLWIENIAVDPCRQGMGIGRALLEQVKYKAAQAGLAEIRLQTNEAFAANVKLYEKFGYQIDRREPFRGGTTVFMSKKL
jgi:ribosomal protein S18 acetylase RimI-like enzyme